MMNSPCAKLITRIIPKMTASPRLIRVSTATPVTTAINTSIRWSIAPSTSQLGIAAGSDARHQNLGVFRIGQQIATSAEIVRRHLFLGLNQAPLAIFDLYD